MDVDHLTIRKVNTSGIISTIAGNRMQGNTGDGGPATAAEFNFPLSVAVDNSGNLFVSDYVNNNIRKINSAGIISTVAGNGTGGNSGDNGQATAAELTAGDIAVDNSGNIYISDRINRVRKINASGIITTIAGNGTSGYSGDGGPATSAALNEPIGVGVDNAGNVYIADQQNRRIRKINTTGIISTFAGGGTLDIGDGHSATSAQLTSPRGVTVDIIGNVFIADFGGERVRKVTK